MVLEPGAIVLSRDRAAFAPRANRRGPQLTVNQVGSQDDVWTDGEQLRLTYCISDDFGTYRRRT